MKARRHGGSIRRLAPLFFCNFKARVLASDGPAIVTNVSALIQKLTLSYMLNSTSLQLYLDVLH